MNNSFTTRSLYRDAMRILNEQPEWVDPYMSADFADGTISISQGAARYTIQFEEEHGLLIAHTSRNNKPLHHRPIACDEDVTNLFTDIYQRLA